MLTEGEDAFQEILPSVCACDVGNYFTSQLTLIEFYCSQIYDTR